ncbi:MAG: putative Ig domain-containing protein, partial [Candidatus Eisenbacteria bacterium]
VYAPPNHEGEEDVPLSVRIEANDADGDPITTLTAAPLPPGATFTAGADQASGVLEWTPARGAAGIHDVTFTASNVLEASATTVITVRPGADRLPAVTAPVGVRGVEGMALAFTATAADPDGNAIESLVAAPLPAGATFSVDPSGTSGMFDWTPALGQAGTYVVQLSAESACRPSGISGAAICARGAAATAITVTAAAQDVAATAFVTNVNRAIRLRSGKPTWCVQVESVNGSYENSGVDLASLSLSFGGGRILAVAAKTSVVGDKNGNGIEELTACFTKEDLRGLFAGLPHGGSTVDVALEGRLFTGESLHADLAIRVVLTGPALSATISPNPMNPEAVLSFVTLRAGWARISLFDLQGRLARRLVDAGELRAGFHEVRVDGLREDGMRLPSGVYFYQVETPEGSALGRVVIAK